MNYFCSIRTQFNMSKKTLLLQEDVFYEDEIHDSLSIIKKYFDVKVIADQDIPYS